MKTKIELYDKVLAAYENIMLNNGLSPFELLKEYDPQLEQQYSEDIN